MCDVVWFPSKGSSLHVLYVLSAQIQLPWFGFKVNTKKMHSLKTVFVRALVPVIRLLIIIQSQRFKLQQENIQCLSPFRAGFLLWRVKNNPNLKT